MRCYIKNLAVITKHRFETLFYQTLQDVIEASSCKENDNLPQRVVNKMLNNELDCDALHIKEDLSLTEAQVKSWITKLAERLRSEDIAVEFTKELSHLKDAKIANIKAIFTTIYATALKEKGAKVICNTSFGFKKVNIQNAIRRRGDVPPPSDGYSSKLLVLDAEYFHYENSQKQITSFTEFRKEFLHDYFHILNTYCEEIISNEQFNTTFKDFI